MLGRGGDGRGIVIWSIMEEGNRSWFIRFGVRCVEGEF